MWCFHSYDTTMWYAYCQTCKISIWVIFNSWYFPRELEERQHYSSPQKESKNCLKNYRPISLFFIFSKIFERLIFNVLFNFFVQNQLFIDCQSGFIPGDSCVLQLPSITQEIHKSFDCNPPEDVRGRGRISKAFTKSGMKD